MLYVKVISALTVGLLILSGCSSTTNLKDPAVRNAISQVKFIESNDGLGNYKTLGSVEARYCQSDQISLTQGGNISREGAITEMRYATYKLGGNGLINVACQTDGVHFGTNCNNSIACYGEAIKN
ncbi:hypothetical protein [Shewanella sp. ALD9]|uniref:hypothetical protein n=1 Tax=Shewanella sp. ALD9 TaxID=2058330 RepID=UPI000C31DBAB|nr:hypothetical protein [Shewanella sp. ALD9]PKH31439.1 hypothetical protein CXF88_12875 [Shewanella sp. ALD9]